MGRILNRYIMPHPPIIVPEVGNGGEAAAAATIEAMKRAAEDIAREAPGTIVISSPHAPCFSDYFYISGMETLEGDFAGFRAPEVKFRVKNDLVLAHEITQKARKHGIAAGGLDPVMMQKYHISGKLDHGTMVPLYFIRNVYPDFKLVHLSTPFLPADDLYAFGQAIAEAVAEMEGDIVYIASGDLSHRLTRNAPAGYNPKGAVYDEELIEKLKNGDVNGVKSIPEGYMEEAGECGTKSIIMMLGTFAGNAAAADVYSYEGPFGVGYMIARVGEDVAKENTLAKALSPQVLLAWESLQEWVREGKRIAVPEWVPSELREARAGVFVSLKKNGNLRGCIGTISPVQKSIAEEIIDNAISACARDMRFEPVDPDELSELTVSVDVLGGAEKIASMDELDVKKYGVIVTAGWKRGLLLPDLEGVDTPEDQVSIALQKAGIRPHEKFGMERFRVDRYT